ncbi:UDP-glucose 4-epimerase 2 [Nymphaea thermarum]|nr:UDP-glucose 4-epimerase 2 [Nymphaea thermarum]
MPNEVSRRVYVHNEVRDGGVQVAVKIIPKREVTIWDGRFLFRATERWSSTANGRHRMHRMRPRLYLPVLRRTGAEMGIMRVVLGFTHLDSPVLIQAAMAEERNPLSPSPSLPPLGNNTMGTVVVLPTATDIQSAVASTGCSYCHTPTNIQPSAGSQKRVHPEKKTTMGDVGRKWLATPCYCPPLLSLQVESNIANQPWATQRSSGFLQETHPPSDVVQQTLVGLLDMKIPLVMAGRRPGDAEIVYASTKAEHWLNLNWRTEKGQELEVLEEASAKDVNSIY